jgi:hypothetical protein
MNIAKKYKSMAGVTGLEPAASGVTGRRSNQLSYTPLCNFYKGKTTTKILSFKRSLVLLAYFMTLRQERKIS